MEAKPWFCTRTTISLTPSCDGGHQLLGHHQVGAVADQHEDLAGSGAAILTPSPPAIS